jgi:hypothetical protein
MTLHSSPHLHQRNSLHVVVSRQRGTAGPCSAATNSVQIKQNALSKNDALRTPPHFLHAVPCYTLVLRGPTLASPLRIGTTTAASLVLPCSLRTTRRCPFFSPRSPSASLPARLQARRQLLSLPRLAQVRPHRRAAARLSPSAAGARCYAVGGRGSGRSRWSKARIRLLFAGTGVDQAGRDVRQGPPNSKHLKIKDIITH